MNMDKSIITPRKLEALIAAYFEARPWDKLGYFLSNGKPHFHHGSRMGGAGDRMVAELRDLGFLTLYRKYEFEPDLKSDKLTAKGYNVLIDNYGMIERVSKRMSEIMPERATLVGAMPLSELQAKRDERAQFEAARQVRRDHEAERQRERNNERASNAKAQKVAKLREALSDGILQTLFRFDPVRGVHLTIATDDQLLEFADRIASI